MGSDLTLAPYDLAVENKFKLRKSIIESLKVANGSDIIIAGEATILLHVAGR